MTNVIPLSFTDFTRVCDEYGKRIYYFQSNNILDLYFISDSMFIWTYLNVDEIDNKEAFFSQRLFMGAIELLFKIPVRDETSVDRVLAQPTSIIKEYEPVENNAEEDIQEKGVEEKTEGV